MLHRPTVRFSWVKAERIALADTARFFISDEQLKCDITHWREMGTLETVIEDHHARHQENGHNQKRVTTSLANDSRFNIVHQINTEGGHVDMPSKFATCNPTATGLLQSRRIRFHYSGCPTAEELQNLHCANEYHWRPEPGKVADRPLLPFSTVQTPHRV